MQTQQQQQHSNSTATAQQQHSNSTATATAVIQQLVTMPTIEDELENAEELLEKSEDATLQKKREQTKYGTEIED